MQMKENRILRKVIHEYYQANKMFVMCLKQESDEITKV